MQKGLAFINFILFSNIYLALIIVLACFTTCNTFRINATFYFYTFIYCSTVSSYCLHWALPQASGMASSRETWTNNNRTLLVSLGILHFLLGIYFFTQLPNGAIQYILPLVFFTFVYTAPKINYKPFILLRQIVVGKTLYLSLVICYTISLLPALLYNASIDMALLLYCLTRLLVIYAICLLFDYRDKGFQEQKKIFTSLAEWPAPKVHTYIMAVLGVAIICSFINSKLMPAQHAPTLILQTAIAAILILVLTKKALHSKNDYLYYGALDGLLGVQILALLIH